MNFLPSQVEEMLTPTTFRGQFSIRAADWPNFDSETSFGANYVLNPNDPDLTPIIWVKNSRDFDIMPDIAWVRKSIIAKFFQLE